MSEGKVDRYGFIKTQREKSEKEIEEEKRESAEEPEKEILWSNYLKNWKREMKKSRDDIAELIKRGIPETMRGTVWSKILDIESLPADINYKDLYQKAEGQEFTITIDKDLTRSLPQIKSFSQKETLERLKHILYAYGQYDHELGYTQGENFIAGLLIHYQEEEIAFKSFIQIMNHPRCLHRFYFTEGFPRLDIAINILRILLQKKYPKILKKIDNENMPISMFATQWFMTAFMAFNWDPEFQMRIFERFIFYGTRGLLGFALVIFSRHKKMFHEAKNFEEMLLVLQHPDTSEQMRDWRYALKKWNKLWIRKGQYQKLLKAVGAPAEKMC
ncbi:TBC domain containing protein [Trichomonas vaginalis G3]|uniref:TBC domain containing protein n=1 Tax=Trichomonas vaginalis (strain ATCC PRA-98 / G3) TaxID=412133 RepID=A2EVI1_TRIV3|nr:regulation of vesicle fusion [Trichomonas vaginalis G3]EAY03313.1 TBC domain containing protein [Trichomonas vaginalis G3]KAI5498348.1 regulation of vesicle fusion [Trichomonas vaginalis G3]|eukprot:XP_001315536.1 TBC domain containing protein [Trichomonas vaginalis G3]